MEEQVIYINFMLKVQKEKELHEKKKEINLSSPYITTVLVYVNSVLSIISDWITWMQLQYKIVCTLLEYSILFQMT